MAPAALGDRSAAGRPWSAAASASTGSARAWDQDRIAEPIIEILAAAFTFRHRVLRPDRSRSHCAIAVTGAIRNRPRAGRGCRAASALGTGCLMRGQFALHGARSLYPARQPELSSPWLGGGSEPTKHRYYEVLLGDPRKRNCRSLSKYIAGVERSLISLRAHPSLLFYQPRIFPWLR